MGWSSWVMKLPPECSYYSRRRRFGYSPQEKDMDILGHSLIGLVLWPYSASIFSLFCSTYIINTSKEYHRYRRHLQGCDTRNRGKIEQPYCRLMSTANRFKKCAIKMCNTTRLEIRITLTKVVFAECLVDMSGQHGPEP